MQKDIFPYQILRWNRTAKECYLRGCVCSGCPTFELYFRGKKGIGKCHMKECVLELVRKFGIPEDLKAKNIIIED